MVFEPRRSRAPMIPMFIFLLLSTAPLRSSQVTIPGNDSEVFF
jgi:hypothetical protein